MRKLNMNRVIKKISILCLLLFLGACGGADIPFDVTQPKADTPDPGVTPPPPGGGNSRCVVKLLQPTVQLLGQGDPSGVPPGHDDGEQAGEFSSNPIRLPDIPLRFNGTQVSIKAIDFPSGANVHLGLDIPVKMADGGDGNGTYDSATGEIHMSGARFELDSPLLGGQAIFPPMELTTETITAHGNFGNLDKTGSRINQTDKTVTLVGGFTIPADFAASQGNSNGLNLLRNGALTLTFVGTLEKIPDGQPCSDSDSGVRMVEVVGSGANTQESAVGENNTLTLGRVYVPQAGTDVVAPDDNRFVVTKKFRLKNGSDKPVSGAFQNEQNFTFAPAGTFTLAPNENKDFTVTYGVAPVADYSLQNVPKSRDVTVSSVVGGVTLNFKTTAKRAAPELVLVGSDSNALSSLDLGNLSLKMLGTNDASSVLRCDADATVSPLSAKVTLMNRGVRALQIAKINAPADAQRQVADPGCINYGNEFLRMGLSLEGGATCQQTTINGHVYNSDQCTILPNANSKINFKVSYLPVNASPVRNAQGGNPVKDSGSMTIQSDDPSYDTSEHKLTLNLAAGVTADKSDILSISKANQTGGAVTDSNRVIRPGGSVRLNVSDPQTEVSQTFYLRNASVQNVREVRLSIVGDEARFFEIQTTPALPTTVGPFTGREPGRAQFTVKYKKLDGTGAHATLHVLFKVGTSNTDNSYDISLVGSVNRRALTGRMKFSAISINAFLNSADIGGSVDSDESRMGRNLNIQPGPIEFEFSGDADSSLRRVKINPAVENIVPSNNNILSDIRALSQEDRKKLFRVYSTRFTRGVGTGGDQYDRTTHDVVCTEPTSLSGELPVGTCAYFYYIIGNHDSNGGYYDDETGDILLPDLPIKLVVPNHAAVAEYSPNLLSVMDMTATISTVTLDSRVVNNFPGSTETLSLVAEQVDNFVLPNTFPGAGDSLLQDPKSHCPVDNWTPANINDANGLPKFGCFVTPTARPFLKGFSFQESGGGKYLATIALIVKFGGAGAVYGPDNRPQNIPSFLQNQVMWVAITGEMEAVTRP